MNTKGVRAMAFLVLLGAHSASAWAQTPLTLDDAVRTAVEKNLSLQRTAWDLDAKERQNDKAWNVFLPSASVSNTLSRSNPAVNSVTGADVKSTWTDSAALSFSLSVSGNILASLEAVALNYRSGLVTYDLAKKGLERSVRLAYYGLLLETENLKITQDSIDRATKNLAKVQANYKAGLVPDLDVLSAQVALEQLKPQLQQLAAVRLNDLGQFKVLLGLPLDQDLVLDGTLSSSVEKDLDLGAVQGSPGPSPDVQRAQLAVEGNALNKKALDLNSWFPSVTLGWTTAPTNVDLFGDLYDGSSPALPKAKNEWQDNGSLSLRLSYSLDSLVPWTGSRETLLQAEDTLKKSRSQLEETRINSELNRQNGLRSIEQAVQSLASLELNVQLAQKTYDMSLDAYNRGTKDLLSLQSSEGDLNSARYKVLSQRYTLLSNILALEYELNVPFGTLWGGKK